MTGIKKIINRYHWDRIAVWSAILIVCFVILFSVGTLLVSGCSRISVKKQADQQAVTAKPFTLPAIPETITASADRAAYLITHYWDSLDFTGASWLADTAAIEQALADYLDIMNYTTPQTAAVSIGATLGKAAGHQDVFDWFAENFEKYLYDVNSPMRDEERYAVVVEHILNNPDVEGIYKIRPAAQLEQINKNRSGSPAADFTYTKADGTTGRLEGWLQNEAG